MGPRNAETVLLGPGPEMHNFPNHWNTQKKKKGQTGFEAVFAVVLAAMAAAN